MSCGRNGRSFKMQMQVGSRGRRSWINRTCLRQRLGSSQMDDCNWAQVNTKSGQGFASSGLITSAWKVTEDPNSAWSGWRLPFIPLLIAGQGETNFTQHCAAGQLSDGRLQLEAITSVGVLHTTWKVSTDPSAAWAPWQSPAPPDPSNVDDLTVGRLADGRCGSGYLTAPAADGTAQFLRHKRRARTRIRSGHHGTASAQSVDHRGDLAALGGERSRSISCRLRRMVSRLKIRHLVLISENLSER